MSADFRHAALRLWRTPLSSLVVVLTLALGLAAAMCVHAVLDRLFQPSALPAAGRVQLLDLNLRAGAEQQRLANWSYPAFAAARTALAPRLQAVAVTRQPLAMTLGWQGAAQPVQVELVSGGYFEALGTPVTLGAALPDPAADALEDRRVWLAHALWRQMFGGSPEVLGQTVRLQGLEFAIAGVLPEGFHGLSEQAALWVPMNAAPALTFARRLSGATSFWHAVFITSASGASALEAQLAAAAVPVQEVLDMRLGGTPVTVDVLARSWSEQRVDPVLRHAGIAVALCVGLLLAIVLLNFGLLSLARNEQRRRELGVRRSIGATRAVLLREGLSEPLLLAVAGWVAACGLAPSVLAWLAGFGGLLGASGRGLAEVELGSASLWLGGGLALGMLIVVAALPLRTLWRRESALLVAADGQRQWRGRRWLAALQFALATALMLGAGVAAQTAWRAVQAPLGFQPDGVLSAQLAMPAALQPSDGVAGFLARWQADAQALPGVQAAASAACLPLRGGCDQVLMAAVPRAADADWPVELNMVGGDYFGTLAIPVLEGRVLDARDDAAATPVAVLSAAAARRYFPDGRVLGQRIKLSMGFPEDPAGALVVGVVADVRATSLDAAAPPLVYLSALQANYDDNVLLLRARAGLEEDALAPLLAQSLARTQPGLALWDVRSMDARFAHLTAQRRLLAGVVSGVAALAVLLAAGGVYAVFNLLAQRRRREFAVRLALGACAGAVRRSVLREAAGTAVPAIAAGLLLGGVAVQWLGSQLPAIGSLPAVLVLAVALAMGLLALLAGWGPARAAARTDPMVVLRQQG